MDLDAAAAAVAAAAAWCVHTLTVLKQIINI